MILDFILNWQEIFSPIVYSSIDSDYRDSFFYNLGWDFTIIPNFPITDLDNALNGFYDNTDAITDYLDSPPTSFADFINFLNDVKNIFSAFQSIGTSISGSGLINSDVKTEFGTLSGELFDYLFATYMEVNSPLANSVLEFLGVIQRTQIANKYDSLGNLIRNSYEKRTLNFNNLKSAIGNGFSYLNNIYYSGGVTTLNTVADANTLAAKLYPPLSLILQALNFQIYTGIDTAYSGSFTTDQYQSGPKMLLATKTDASGNSFGLYLNISSIAEGNFGFVIIPFGNFNLTQTFGEWDITSSLSASVSAITLKDGKITLPTGMNNIDFTVDFTNNIDLGPTVPKISAGIGSSVLLNIYDLGGKLDVEVDSDQTTKFKIEFSISNAEFIITRSDTDSFINKVIPEGGINAPFQFTIGYSSSGGFYIGGGAGLEANIPIHLKLLGIEFSNVLLSAKVSNGEIPLTIATSFDLNVGPLNISVTNIGIRGTLSFPGSGGNLGKMNFDTSFKPPTGLGISIEADPVSGGGFLNYDESTYTYTGALQLKFSKISLNAIGILTTRMPDGSDGYSLLIIITADFTPIQLGMGFTLNGVGGLLGLNRTMNTDRLRSGVKDGSLDYILFPQNVVANANTIISNLGQAFPVQQGQFLIGPMAKIGWGTPTLLTIELGIIIEMPSPVVLAILGVIKAVLPSDTNRILAIQVNFLGIIDFSKKYLSFDASLYDSKILTFGLVGDMALRLYWGDNPAFLLSVGGFHPKYTPPPAMNLPAMQRLAIILANDSNLKINVQTYFAVTSNTAQFGASVSAMAHAWKIQAVGAVWFDVLFQFSPFHFMADMGAMFAIKMGSSTILSIYVDLSLEGPNPWRAQGKASFKIVFVRVHVSFDKTFGQASVDNIAPVQVMPQLQSAIGNKDNWQVIGPDRSHEVVTFRQISVGSGQLVVDPFGSLQLSQKIVPLGVTIGKFGNSKASDDNSFSIGAITSGAISFPTGTIRDYFAPSSFFFLSDDQKLSRASYELYNSGVSIGNTDAVVADYCVSRQLGYEDIIVDTRQRFRLSAFAALSSAEYAMHTAYNYVSDSKYSTFSGKVPPSGPGKVSMNTATSYVVADKNSLGQVGSVSFGNYTEASLHLDSLMSSDPTNAVNYAVMNAFELN